VRSRTRLIGFSAAGIVGLAAFAAPMIANAATQAPVKVFSVSSFGAKPDGKTNAAPATNAAIKAAAKNGGGIIDFSGGTFVMAGTVHLASNTTIRVNKGSTITGSSGGYDHAESNPNDRYQDYGHSHFHNAMFYGNKLDKVTFTGGGTITGGGHLITGNPKQGQADKIISLTNCTNLDISNITLARGGHFAALINGCNHVHSDHLTISTASDRDGWNIINTSNVAITNLKDAANDDALAFKSDWALGKRFTDQGHVRVTKAQLSARCCNALMFGSETCSDFKDYVFDTIKITGASKSGLGMVSMDGTHISDVHYRNITMTGVASPIMQKIGTRARCGDHPGVGSISNIEYTNVTGVGKGPFSPTIWGNDSGHEPNHITFTNVHLTVPGGSSSTGTGVPSNNPKDYNPKSIGTRPAYGWYIRFANNITFRTDHPVAPYLPTGVEFKNGDSRAAVIVNNSASITFTNFTFEKSRGPNDFVFQNTKGYCTSGVTPTPRISASGSTKSC
jgi:polygalacturonase